MHWLFFPRCLSARANLNGGLDNGCTREMRKPLCHIDVQSGLLVARSHAKRRVWIWTRQGTGEHGTGKFREPAGRNACATRRNLRFYAPRGGATVIADETVADS